MTAKIKEAAALRKDGKAHTLILTFFEYWEMEIPCGSGLGTFYENGMGSCPARMMGEWALHRAFYRYFTHVRSPPMSHRGKAKNISQKWVIPKSSGSYRIV